MIQNNYKYKHIHILGIAGTFMASLAVLAKQQGLKVTGSDQAVYPPMSDILKEQDIEYVTDYDLDSNKIYLDSCDQIIIGNVIRSENPCVQYILENNKDFNSGAEWLYKNILKNKYTIAVSGTHGKTTTSSMLAWILEQNGLNPSFLIGGLATNFGCSSRLTDSQYFVIEADEYDTAFFDKRPKFLHYYPSSLIINNLEFDHADIYKDLSAIEQQFHYLLRVIPYNTGHVIMPLELSDKFTEVNKFKNSQYFGINNKNNTNIFNSNLLTADGSNFECIYNNISQGIVRWNCMGDHNVNNAMAAILAANTVGVAIPDAINSLSSFKGVARRLQKKAELANNVIIFDDFAHHPTAIKTTLDGIDKHYRNSELNNINNRRIVVVLDFNSYSMRNKIHSNDDFIKALEKADIIYFYQNDNITWDLNDIANVLNKTKKDTIILKSKEKLINHLSNNIISNDIVVFMTKSDFNKSIDLLVNKLELEKQL